MAERRRSQVHDGAAAGTEQLNSVFIDTNLGTHIAVSVCSFDTISDLKKKVTVAHKQSFPEIGEIEVHSVKLEQRSNYYHLPDDMLVWTAFGEVNRNWFLSVTASIVPTHPSARSCMNDIDDDCNGFVSDRNKNAIVLFALPACAAQNIAVSETTDSHRSIYAEEHCMRTESPVKKKRKVRHTKDKSHDSGFEGGDTMFCPSDKDVKPDMSDSIVKVSGPKNDEYDDEGRLLYDRTYLPNIAEKGNFGSILDYQNLNGTDRPKEDNMFESVVDGLDNEVVSVFVPGSSAGMRDAACKGGDVNTLGEKKKRKFEKTAGNNHDRTYMEQFGKGERTKASTLKMKEGMGLSLENDHEVLMPSNSKASDHVIPDLSPKEEILLQSAKKSNFTDQNSHKRLDSDERKEDNVLDSKIDYEDKDVPSMHSGGVHTNISDPYATIMDAGVGTGEMKSDGKKRKKKKVNKNAEVQHMSDVAPTEIGEMNKPLTETTRLEEKGASLELDNEVIVPADSKAPDHVGPDLALKEAIIVRDADAVTEPEISSSVKKMKKNKRAKNSVITNIENSDIKDIHNGARGSLDLSSPSGDHITKGIGKDESTILNDGMDVEMRPLDAKVQHMSDVAHTEIGEMNKPLTETTRLKEKGASLKLDNEIIMPADNKAPDHVGPDLALKETSIVGNADAVMEAEISSCVKKMKKKRKSKNSVSTIENSGIKDIHNGTRGSLDLSSPSGDHITKGIRKDESARLNEGMDVEMRPLDASNHDTQKKVWDVNRKEADLAETQAEQTLEDVSVRNEMMTEKGKCFQDVCHAALPATETENTMIMRDADAVMEPEVSSCIKKTKKKRRGKNSVSTNIENSGIKDTQNGTRGPLDLSSPSGVHITSGIGKNVSTRLNDGMDVEMTLLNASNNDAQEKVWDVNRKEEERTSEDLSDRNKMMMEKTKSFPDVCHAALPTADTENTIMKPNQANQDDENTENKSRKATKKGRKQKHTAKDVQENFPVEDEQVGVEPLATKETSFGFANSELAGRDVGSSQVLSRKSEEKVDENYELVLNTDGLKENTEKGSEGINFKQYFVADQLQNQVDISNKVRKANKLKSSKAKDNELLKTSSPSELCEMPRQKPNDFVAPSSSHKKNPSLDKSSSKRSATLLNNKGNERMLLRSHVKKTMPMKTPKKKILLAKSGTIFHNDSGESSGDENRTLFSDDRTLTSSESSSMSGDDSEGESEASQISTCKGSSAAKGKSLAMLEEENVTMDVILRSSKRFKKAKEIASQIEESQPIDFVPDSQPV